MGVAVVEVVIGNNVSLNMGTKSVTRYQLDPTEGSLDLSLVNNVQALLDDPDGFTGPEGDDTHASVTVNSTGDVFTAFGDFSDASPANWTTTGFELRDSAAALIFGMDFPAISAYPYVEAIISGSLDDLETVVSDYLENLTGQQFTIRDGNLGNRINGDAAGDRIYGRGGADVLGGLGGADKLYGGGGADKLSGGKGHDVLTGDAGNDKFVFKGAPASSVHSDTITDFLSGTDDIQLDNAMFTNLGAAGALTNTRFFKSAGSTANLTADDRVIYNTSNGNLYYDADGGGGGASVLIAKLTGAPVLVAGDIQVI